MTNAWWGRRKPCEATSQRTTEGSSAYLSARNHADDARRERGAGRQLFVPAGVVWLASDGQTFEAESLASLTALGIPVERWSHNELARSVPVSAFAPVVVFVLSASPCTPPAVRM